MGLLRKLLKKKLILSSLLSFIIINADVMVGTPAAI